MASLDTIGGLHYEMMRRCYNEKSVAYKDYGAKGITVCEEWHDRETFRKWCKENGYVKGLRLNRKDGKSGYFPQNCYFGNISTRREDSCSQMQKKRVAENNRKKKEAGISGKIQEDELYVTYVSMHSRCENPKHINYANYGERGIKVCDEWSGKDGFFHFRKWANENGWHKDLSLDRIDNDKGYSPSNCKWSTRTEQNFNKRNNIYYEYCGISMPLGMIARLENVKYSMLYSRVRKKGMSVTQAISDIKEST